MSERLQGGVEISVVVPVYNAEPYVEKCIGSILGQAAGSFEVIAVNDCSTDGSLAVLHRLGDGDPRMIVIDLPENRGILGARQAGMAVAKGTYVAFADADDWMDPEMLQTMRGETEAGAVDVVICGARMVDAGGRKLPNKAAFRRRLYEGRSVFEAFCRFDLGTGAIWNKLYKRDLIQPFMSLDFGWRPDAGEDTLVNIGCFHEAKRVKTIDKILYNYFIHDNNVTVIASNALAFSRVVRGYAAAVEIYSDFAEEDLQLIDVLFRKQLAFPRYHVSDPQDLAPHRAMLEEAIGILAKNRPGSLYEIANLGLSFPRSAEVFRPAHVKWMSASWGLLKSLARRVKPGKK